MRNRSIAIVEAENERDAMRAQRDVAEARLAGVLDALAELVRTTRSVVRMPAQQYALSHAEALLVEAGRSVEA